MIYSGKDEGALMGTIEKKTNCHYCGYLCGFIADVEDGRIESIRPDTSRYPYDEKVFAGCPRWKMNMDALDSPRRVNYPLRRTGERGSGEWERVSWEEALDEIAARLDDLREKHGPGTLASMIGGPHTSFWPLHRFMSNFGSPNNMGIGQICWNPRIWVDAITFGWTIEVDITDQTNTLIIWGTNPAESDNSVFWRHILKMSNKNDPDVGHPEIIVIDPRFTKTARRADIWIAPKPGTDCALALSFINVIIDEGLYDKDFVTEWCIGFDEVKEHVRDYSPEIVADVCGVDADDIRRVARMFARKPSALISGRGIDQVGKNVLPTHRARCILLAITGNLDIPGANCLAEPSDFVQELELEDSLRNEETLRKYCLNTEITPLQSYDGYDTVMRAMNERGDDCGSSLGDKKMLPLRYLASAHPDLVLHAMETGDPYPVRALMVEATNPILTYADTHRVHDALMGLDLIVVLDYYMTPTAALADFVLPSAASMERPTFQAHGGVANMAYGGDAAVDPYYERKVDYDVFRELGIRLGQEDVWPWKDFREACEYTLSPTGMDWETYCELGMCFIPPKYQKHLLPKSADDPQGARRGFSTASGKVELASDLVESLGGDRLPKPSESCKLCSDEFIESRKKDGWVHVELITGGRKQPYNASMYFDNPDFRKRCPYPLVEMNEQMMDELELKDGDTCCIATDNGEAYFKVAKASIRYGLIHADYGWWHPEWDVADGREGGIWESNINLLTSCSLDQAEPLIGTWSYNAIDCMIKKSDHCLSWEEKYVS